MYQSTASPWRHLTWSMRETGEGAPDGAATTVTVAFALRPN